MNPRHDPELADILQDQELLRLGELLGAAQRPEPPLDEAFRSGLRRQLMQQAWEMSEGRPSLWKRAFAPPGIAWIGATAGLLLIASVVVFMVTQPLSPNDVSIQSPMDGSSSVALAQPILVKFNRPMDHLSTQAAVQIAPATNVTYSWQVNTLAVQPTSGNLAPNTQYQVTIGPGARTASGQLLGPSQTITFVTQPPAPAPSPPPTPRVSATPPATLLAAEHLLAPLGGGAGAPLQWSADSSTVYFVTAKGALTVVPAKGGEVRVVAADGVSSPAISPEGDRLAYIRDGKIEVLTFAAGATVEVLARPSPTLVGWAKDRLVWAAADGLYTQGAIKPVQLAPLPTGGDVTVLAIAPDGAHVVYHQNQKLFLLDMTTAKSAQLGQPNASFYGWSPSGLFAMYSTPDSVVIADLRDASAVTLPGGDASWSSQDAILLGSDTDLYQVRPDGSGLMKLSNGTYHLPVWAPNGTSFAFFRGGALWTASAPALPQPPTVIDQATALITSFMEARLKTQSELATTYLDDNAKQAYSSGRLSLLISGDPRFSRFYLLTQQVTGAQPDAATFVVRLVLTHGKVDVADFEETLTVIRDTTTRTFVIDKVAASAQRGLGKGAEVVGVVVAAGSVQVNFDSDLDPATATDGVRLFDAKGKPIEVTATYTNRTVTLGDLDLKPGAQYRLAVLTTVRDVLGHNVASEYSLQLLGPMGKDRDTKTPPVAASPAPPSPSPSPSPTPSPGPSPSPNN